MNSHSERNVLHSAGLCIDAAAGQVLAGVACVRLGPVNMKVLMLLLESNNRVLTRAEFFDRVWARQVVSDDVLTRSISDLRTLLGAHTDVPVLIETIPKRGYRWVPPVATAPADTLTVAAPRAVDALPVPPPIVRGHGVRILAWLAAMLAGLLILSSLVLWTVGNYAASGRIKVAMLPIQTSADEHRQLATELEGLLRDQLLNSPQFEVLSFSATSPYLQNPFPILARQYGVQYILESRIQTWQSEAVFTLNLVDARSASVVDSVNVQAGATADLRLLSGNLVGRFGQRLTEL